MVYTGIGDFITERACRKHRSALRLRQKKKNDWKNLKKGGKSFWREKKKKNKSN
jgi:hypothetical protein